MFGKAIDYGPVRIRRRRWFLLQRPNVVMAPCGHLHFHPRSPLYRDDFSQASPGFQGLFVHEMTHIWQAQQKGRWYLPLMRHPFCRYAYAMEPGKPFGRYGIEQQAEIVQDAFLLSQGARLPDKPGLDAYVALLPFAPSA